MDRTEKRPTSIVSRSAATGLDARSETRFCAGPPGAPEKPAPAVRLDCVTANQRLCRYYLERGWTHVRDITDEIGTESLFERSAWYDLDIPGSRKAGG